MKTDLEWAQERNYSKHNTARDTVDRNEKNKDSKNSNVKELEKNWEIKDA